MHVRFRAISREINIFLGLSKFSACEKFQTHCKCIDRKNIRWSFTKSYNPFITIFPRINENLFYCLTACVFVLVFVRSLYYLLLRVSTEEKALVILQKSCTKFILYCTNFCFRKQSVNKNMQKIYQYFWSWLLFSFLLLLILCCIIVYYTFMR